MNFDRASISVVSVSFIKNAERISSLALFRFQFESLRCGRHLLQRMGDILETISVGDLVATKGRVISVPDTATVKEVLSVLSANNITAVPVAASGNHWLGAGGTDIHEGSVQYIVSSRLFQCIRKRSICRESNVRWRAFQCPVWINR